MAALLQGGYSRRVTSKIGEGVMAQRGMYACALGFALLASLPHLEVSTTAPKVIYGAAACLAFTSATVVSSLTSLASLQCDDVPITGVNIKVSQELAKGRALGSFRSAGQLGRALGPLLGVLLRFMAKILLLNHSRPHCSISILLDFWSIVDLFHSCRVDACHRDCDETSRT